MADVLIIGSTKIRQSFALTFLLFCSFACSIFKHTNQQNRTEP